MSHNSYAKDLTVIIPTANRPKFLETAMWSVASQTIKDRIDSVLVIENGVDRKSEDVCRNQEKIPVEYIFNQTPLPIGYPSFIHWFSQVTTEYTALLCDDDWWFPFHLEAAMQRLTKAPEPSAFYGGSIVTHGEKYDYLGSFGKSNLDFAAPDFHDYLSCDLTTNQVILATTPSTCLHLSSLVAKTSDLLQSLELVRDGNPYDVDRLIPIELSKRGVIAANKYPTVAIRRHKTQGGNLQRETGKAWWTKTNAKIAELVENELNQNIGKLFNEHIGSNPELNRLLRSSLFADSGDFLESNGVEIGSRHKQTSPQLRKILENLTPPIFWKIFSCLRRD